jgi:transcriptional regulator with XRE-family HTH domain
MISKKEKLIGRLKNKKYRDSFVESYIKIGIPFQLRALREERGWTQKELADRIGVKQAWIAQIENPNYSGFSLKTLLKLASVFDIGLLVRFVSFSNLMKWELELSSESLKVKSFEDEDYFKPPVINIVSQGGVIVRGEGIVNFINPSQTQVTNLAFLDEYRKPKEVMKKSVKEMRSPLQEVIMGARQ